jgi:hypothetical protein
MKTIKYKKKETNANTQYVEVNPTDLDFILNQCKQLVDVATQCKEHKIKEGDDFFKPSVLMPKQSTGKRNTAESMCSGVIDNFSSGQRDLTEKTMTGLHEAFKVGEAIIEDFHSVEFEECDSLPKLSAPVIESKGTTMEDLFDIESITVTYRKKQ